MPEKVTWSGLPSRKSDPCTVWTFQHAAVGLSCVTSIHIPTKPSHSDLGRDQNYLQSRPCACGVPWPPSWTSPGRHGPASLLRSFSACRAFFSPLLRDCRRCSVLPASLNASTESEKTWFRLPYTSSTIDHIFDDIRNVMKNETNLTYSKFHLHQVRIVF